MGRLMAPKKKNEREKNLVPALREDTREQLHGLFVCAYVCVYVCACVCICVHVCVCVGGGGD